MHIIDENDSVLVGTFHHISKILDGNVPEMAPVHVNEVAPARSEIKGRKRERNFEASRVRGEQSGERKIAATEVPVWFCSVFSPVEGGKGGREGKGRKKRGCLGEICLLDVWTLLEERNNSLR